VEDIEKEDTVIVSFHKGEFQARVQSVDRKKLLESRFLKAHHSGRVTAEVDFRLSANVVRKPDVAFISEAHLKGFDFDHTPIEGAPSLAVEVISPSNLAQDTLKKVRQYLAAGSDAVWLVYPALGVIEIHERNGVRDVTMPDSLNEEHLFPSLKFSLSLTDLFDESE
ncbi:MAG: Uma2 family endonuclease, partial [Acidobacteriia bacterium]|nr:Uma2 family endonuclease [Terriglobia bacterium]